MSGGHCNPAVTVATWLAARQEQNFVNTAFYVGTQIAAAVAASRVAGLLALVQPGSAGSSCAAPYPQVPSATGACVQTSDCTTCPDVDLQDCANAAGCGDERLHVTSGIDGHRHATIVVVTRLQQQYIYVVRDFTVKWMSIMIYHGYHTP